MSWSFFWYPAGKAVGHVNGGNLPLGYELQTRHLVINEPQAETVRYIFSRYEELGTVSDLQAHLKQKGIVSKVWTSTTARIEGSPAVAEVRCTTCSDTGFTSVG